MEARGKLFQSLPFRMETELFEQLVEAPGVRIERIVSQGHASPAEGWYDQEEHEWVCVLQGEGHILIEGEAAARELKTGDYLLLPAHCRHKVTWTASEPQTIWLAVFFMNAPRSSLP